MPAQRTEQSSPFRLPQGSQAIDLTLSDVEDLAGEVVRIPNAEEVDDVLEFDQPGGVGWEGSGAERVSIAAAGDSQEGSTKPSAGGSGTKRGSTHAAGRALAHKRRAELHLRRQTRG